MQAGERKTQQPECMLGWALYTHGLLVVCYLIAVVLQVVVDSTVSWAVQAGLVLHCS